MRTTWWSLIGLSVVLAGCGGGGGAAPLPDNTPPAISQIAVERVDSGVAVSATVQDAGTGVATVVVIATVGNTTQTVPMVRVSANRYQGILPANTARVRLRAQDFAGNTRETGDIIAPPPLPPF
ncbi:MAG: hypothetical protein NZ550_03140 [Fimbriimonadales bacterium]|nr:hypothetical protein [Fimbriimonadales bacterium]